MEYLRSTGHRWRNQACRVRDRTRIAMFVGSNMADWMEQKDQAKTCGHLENPDIYLCLLLEEIDRQGNLVNSIFRD
jgi:hypothetical protein